MKVLIKYLTLVMDFGLVSTSSILMHFLSLSALKHQLALSTEYSHLLICLNCSFSAIYSYFSFTRTLKKQYVLFTNIKYKYIKLFPSVKLKSSFAKNIQDNKKKNYIIPVVLQVVPFPQKEFSTP